MSGTITGAAGAAGHDIRTAESMICRTTGKTPDQIADLLCLSSPHCKNISVFPKCKSVYMICHPVLLRGALAIVTNVGRVAVDAKVPLTNGAGAYGEVVWS
jgi:hypothetical protein